MAESSLGQLLSELISDLARLLRQELRLARSEAAEKLRQAEHGFYIVVAGLMAAFCALLLVVLAAVLALSNTMPAWAASLTVGLVLALLALLLLRQGRASLRARNLIPARRRRSGRSDGQAGEANP